MSEPSYIRKLRVFNNRVDRDFEIDMTPTEGREFMHLILTGRNGSGKTTTLELLQEELRTGTLSFEPLDANGDFIHHNNNARLRIENLIKRFGVLPFWNSSVPSKLLIPESPAFSKLVYMSARKQMNYQAVRGPTKQLVLEKSAHLEQILVNLRTQIAYALEDGDQQVAQAYRGRLDSYQSSLRHIFDDQNLELVFDRDEIRYRVSFDGRIVDIPNLPDGLRSALFIWSEIQSAVEMAGKDDWGIVIIDELEAHLHLAIQEKLLPFLTASFPRMQFIVATHSPVVISSIDGAVVYDLSTHTHELSDDLRGMEYGTLMTGHFGISSDFDIKSAAELRELKALHDKRKEGLTPAEEARLRELAAKLSERSHALALKVWNELEFGAA